MTTTAIETNIRRSCGHTEIVALDESTKSWKRPLSEQPCLCCKPTYTVTHLCGHEGTYERTLSDTPRRAESKAMQLCPACNH